MGDRIVVMNAGEIAQLGTPAQVYLTPASLYVAQTIGSPAMNLFSGRATASSGKLSLSGSGWALDMQGDGASALIARLKGADTPVTAGIRPEDLDLGGIGATFATGPCLTAEPLGSETLYNIDIAGTSCRVVKRETAVSLPEGGTARVQLRPGARLHLFGPDGLRIGGAVQGDTDASLGWHPDESVAP